MLPSIQLVVNPNSGNGRALAIAGRLESALVTRGYPTRMLAVRDLAEAARWASDCRKDFAYLCCVGGDSTLCAVAPACMRLSVPLLPVPVGFGNTFARAFDHHARLGAVLQMLEQGEVRRVDAGDGGDGVFLVARAFGFLWQVQQAVEGGEDLPRPAALRYLAYVQRAVRSLRHMPLPRVRVEVDGERLPGEAALAIVANVPTYRGFLNLTPLASPLDGLLDVFCVPRTTKLRLVSLLFAALLRPPSGRGPAISRRARRVWLEVEGQASEELTVLPGALPVLVPAGWPNDGAPRRQRRSAADGPASRRLR